MTNNIVKKFLAPMILGLLFGSIFYFLDVNRGTSFNQLVSLTYTFSANYTQVLAFIAPIMILVFVGLGCNNLQGNSTAFFKKYLSNIAASMVILGLITLSFSILVIPHFITQIEIAQGTLILPINFLVLDLQPLFSITVAIFMGVSVGMIMKQESLIIKLLRELEYWLSKFMVLVMLPLMPFWIFGTFLRNGYMNQSKDLVINDVILSIFIIFIQLMWLIIMFFYGAKKNGMSFISVLKAGYTIYLEIIAMGGIGTGLIIPISIKEQETIGIETNRAKIIASSSFNMPGSLISNVVFAVGIINMHQLDVGLFSLLVYLFALMITLVAAPSVPGSVFAVTSTLLTPLLGFNTGQIELMGALYNKQGPTNSATNHSADVYMGLLSNEKTHKKHL